MNRVFIESIAEQVRNLISDTSARKTFIDCIEKFNEYFICYWNATTKLSESIRKKTAKGKQKAASTNLQTSLKILAYTRKVKLPPDPVKWQIDDKRVCRYTTLAVIYDMWIEIGNPAPEYLCKNIVDDKLFGYMKTLIGSGWGVYSNKAIKETLFSVMADLKFKPKTQNQQDEWSNPMSKSDMMTRLNINGYKKFNTFAKQYRIRPISNNRQLWQICLNDMDKNTRQKLEKI